MMPGKNIRKAGVLFDHLAQRYDEWFESSTGRPIFEQEVDCLHSLIGRAEGRWLEVGVGTGRFAKALGIREGIDPSTAVLGYASNRGLSVEVGAGEDLPYADNTFDGVLMVVTICFLADPERALKECHRVMKVSGRLIVGLVPADSPWGKLYARQGRDGHRFYSAARFYTCEQVMNLITGAGFGFDEAMSCLFTPPGVQTGKQPPRKGIVTEAGFVGLAFRKPPLK